MKVIWTAIWSFNIGQVSIVFGLLCALWYFIQKIRKTRKFEGVDLAPLTGAFLAGCNIPAALFLICYGINPDPATVATKLHSYEKFVSLAGLSLLATAGLSIFSAISSIVPIRQEEALAQPTQDVEDNPA